MILAVVFGKRHHHKSRRHHSGALNDNCPNMRTWSWVYRADSDRDGSVTLEELTNYMCTRTSSTPTEACEAKKACEVKCMHANDPPFTCLNVELKSKMEGRQCV